MNILVATSSFPPEVGGTAAYTFEICRGLLRQRYDITLWTKSSVIKQGEIPPGFDVITVEDSQFTASWLRRHRSELAWQEVLRNAPPDLVLVPKLDAFSSEPLFWAREHKIPFAVILHGNETISKNDPLLAAPRIFTVSNAVRQRLPEPLIDRSIVIANGVDTMRFSVGKPDQSALERIELLSVPPGILNVGSWLPFKGQALLLEAMTHLEPPPAGPELWLVGSGPEERKLRQLADKYHLFDRIRWLGQINDEELISVYRSAQFVVLASNGTTFGALEGFGLPVLEAAACGKPAVVSNNGGLPEAVVTGETGIVVEDPSPAAFAAAIKQLWSQPELRAKMGQAARERATQDFTWEAILQKLGRELRKIINENKQAVENEHEE